MHEAEVNGLLNIIEDTVTDYVNENLAQLPLEDQDQVIIEALKEYLAKFN